MVGISSLEPISTSATFRNTKLSKLSKHFFPETLTKISQFYHFKKSGGLEFLQNNFFRKYGTNAISMFVFLSTFLTLQTKKLKI